MRPIFTLKIRVGIVLLLLLSSSISLAANIPFSHVVLDNAGPKDPWAKMVGDINGDGFLDVIIGGRSGPLVWYSYPNWTKTTITKGGYKTVDGQAGDVDGDGDLDIVMGGLIWYENPRPHDDPAKDIWKAHKVANHPTHDIELGDLDKDGDMDIVTRDQSEFGHKAGNTIHLWRQDGTGSWTERIIECPHGEGITLGDIDRDGDLDIVIGGIWFENTRDIINGQWSAHRFANWHSDATIQIADINGDALPDVVLSPAELKGNFYKMSWFEAPSDPKKGDWSEHIIAESIECVIHGLVTADINGDGAIDVVSAEMHQSTDPDEVAVYLNQSSGLSWNKQIVSTRGSHYIQVGDIGNDGDIDIIGANWSGDYQPIEMWENKSKTWIHLSSMKGDIPKPDVERQAASLVLDIDKDGVNDFVIAGWSEETSMVWFRHTSTGWKRYLLDNRQSHIEAGGTYWDIDGDGDLDILQGGSWATNEVWWWENPYPNYKSNKPWNRYTIKNEGQKQHHDQIFGDFDGDGKAELVFWNQTARKLLIADIPDNPKKKDNWSFTEIWSWPRAFKYEGFAKADIDLDGKIDLIGGGMWFKHNGGKNFTANIVDQKYGMSRSAAGDFIKGGQPEIVLNSGDGIGPLNLYEWKVDKWIKHTLIEKVDHGHTLQVGDINSDGNLDIYAAEMYRPGPGDKCRQLILYGDGKGNFKIQIVSTGIGTHEGRIGDMDGDGDLDILQKDFQEHQRVDIWLNNGTYKAKGAWLDGSRKYRVPVRVNAAGYNRLDKPVEVEMNFTQLLRRTGKKINFDAKSIRVTEVDASGDIIKHSVKFQFDKAPGFNPGTNAKGKITFMADGKIPANSTRIFHVYFSHAETAHSPPSFKSLVRLTSVVEYQGQESFKIETQNATYYYHKQGAGFAGIIDKDGNDWLGYRPGGGPAGEYRGIPNMGYPEGYCHPGKTVSNSKIISRGPIKISIFSRSNDGKMECIWDIFPAYARLTVLKMRTPYWFLYEGTPGGKLDEDSDYCIRPGTPNGMRTLAKMKWDVDISVPGHLGEWLYFGDDNRAIFLIHHEDDEATDSYWPMQSQMTVFGFGRKGLNKFMDMVPAHFTIGLCECSSFAEFCKIIKSAYSPMVIEVGNPEIAGIQ
ncbi:MAG: VCBS repeat-containing protein [Planctomycetes bacterium]|nr:VCBS repeat-containing protein [Planctomycetota bacterium]